MKRQPVLNAVLLAASHEKKRVRLPLLLSMAMAVLVLAALFFFAPFTAVYANAKNDYVFDGVQFRLESLTLKTGGSATLALREINAGEEAPVWASSDPAVATVENGIVSAHAPGKAEITVTKGQFSDTLPVTVTEEDPVLAETARTAALYRDFLDLRFGMFLHFNSSTYEFASIGGDWGGEDRASTFQPKTWNPTELDCAAWAKAAKSAGMTFAVLTTKHHDGFDLWDSAYTDYDVGSATDQRDVVKLFTDACREEGIAPGLYFSMLDVKHKITSKSCTGSDVEFIKAQLRELLTGYGEIPFLIFDGWNAYWGGPNYTKLPYDEIVNLVHTYQPNCLVINISCEANNTHSQVAMFESAAGQSVPDWFDNLNISCNTPTSHWFWCHKYTSETFKSADWVIDTLDDCRADNTVFILNVSPDGKGQLIKKYTDLLAEVGEKYRKPGDVTDFPAAWMADYDPAGNLLYRKMAESLNQNENAGPERAVDGFCDPAASHETTFQSGGGSAAWRSDIGYNTALGKLYVHVGNEMSASMIDRTYLYLFSDDPGRATYAGLEKKDPVLRLKLSDGEKTENCYAFDLAGISARYLSIACATTGTLCLSEVILTPADFSASAPSALRAPWETVTGTVGSPLALPERGLFVRADGGLVWERVTWNSDDAQLSRAGLVTLTGQSAGGCAVSLSLHLQSAGRYTEVPVQSVTASSMWSQAASLGWAHVRNLIDKSGLTASGDLFAALHDNPYNATTMWHSLEGQRTAWLLFDFGRQVTVDSLLVWNHNQENEADRGVKTMVVYYSDKAAPSASDWILAGTYTLHKASGQPAQAATDFLSLGSLSARTIKLELTENFGDPSVIGLAEVAFFAGRGNAALDYASIDQALLAFEALSKFDYPAASWKNAEAIYQTALSAREDAATQSELDRQASALDDAMTVLKTVYAKKTPKGLSDYSFTLTPDGEGFPVSLPDTVALAFTDGSRQEADVVWDACPAAYLAAPGSFTLRGKVAGAPYTVTARILVEGLWDAPLRSLVDELGKLAPVGAAEEDAAAYTAALTAARALLADADRTQAQVDAAKAALVAARNRVFSLLAPSTTDPAEPSDPVDPPTSTAPDSSVPGASPVDESPLSRWVIAAIVLGIVIVAAALGALVWIKVKKSR